MSANVFAQKPRPMNLPKYDSHALHFGFTIGLNAMNFTIHQSDDFFNINATDSIYSVENSPQPGFNLGIISDVRLMENLNMRFLPGLSFGARKLTYFIYSKEKRKFEKIKPMDLESIFLNFPLVFKYRAKRLNNYRPYLLFGGSYKYDLAAQRKIKEQDKPKVRLKRNDFFYEVGFGIDYYLPYFKFATELKFAVGMFNILEDDGTQFSSAIRKMNSKMIILSFHFE